MKKRYKMVDNAQKAFFGDKTWGTISIFKVGNDGCLATDDDILAVTKEIERSIKEKRPMVLSHPVEVIEFSSLDFQVRRPIIRVGSTYRPATKDDIKNVTNGVRRVMRDAAKGKDSYFVTHHEIEILSVNDSPSTGIEVLGHADPIIKSKKRWAKKKA